MHKIIIITFILLTSFFAHAQPFFGAKAGLNLSDFAGKDASGITSKKGFNTGGFVNIPVNKKIKLQPEILFSTEGGKSSSRKYLPILINLPVLLQYHVKKGFYAETGPQFGVLSSFKIKFNSDSLVDVKNNYKSLNFSWGVGVGYFLKNGIGVNARYNIGLGSALKDGDDRKINNLSIGFFYIFNKIAAKK